MLVGQVVQRVEGSAPEVRKRSSQLTGARVVNVRTHGKHLMIDTDRRLTIHIHLGMPGRFRTTRTGRPPPGDYGAVRLGLTTEVGSVWVLGAPTIDVDRKAVIDHRLRRLGADVLAPEFDWERFEHQAGRYPADRTVSDFLLDQRVMAGVGNEYKCEVLFLEGLAPDLTMESIDLDRRRALAERARKLMLPNAERSERSTTGRRHPGAQAWVFQRTGRPCRRCGDTIVQRHLGEPSRITYWCPTCQRPGGAPG